jgi:ribosomal protein L12E/L44/L45/RPP1/RPP2
MNCMEFISSDDSEVLVLCDVAVGIEADSERVEKLLEEVSGRDISEILAEGLSKLAAVPSGGGGGGVAAAPAAAGGGGGAAAKEEKKEEKKKVGTLLTSKLSPYVEYHFYTSCAASCLDMGRHPLCYVMDVILTLRFPACQWNNAFPSDVTSSSSPVQDHLHGKVFVASPGARWSSSLCF